MAISSGGARPELNVSKIPFTKSSGGDNIHHCYLTAVWDRFELYHDRRASVMGNVPNPGSKMENACFTTSLASVHRRRTNLKLFFLIVTYVTQREPRNLSVRL
ncbi:hypothetical protein TNCV_1886011 [Trichonephila clavipes]|nr:hypothetical protein TNCV_1886011 [Trichonephila clavipes]